MATAALRTAVAGGLVAMLAACGPAPDDPGRAAAADTRSGIRPAAAFDDVDAPPAAGTRLAQADAAASAGAGDLGELRAEVQELRREVREVRLQLAHGPAAVHASASEPDPRTDPGARQAAQLAERQRVAAAESAFQGEQRDPRWATGTAAAIQSALSQGAGDLRSQVRSIDCRAQTCRLELDPTGGPQAQEALPMVIAQLGQALPHVTGGQAGDGDGHGPVVLYLSR